MQKYKLGWRFWFFLILLSGVIALGIPAVSMLFKGEVSYEDGEMPKAVSVALGIMICIVLSSYLLSVVMMLRQLIKFRGIGLEITPRGIENTFVFLYLFAFVIVVPVRLIPWETVKYFDKDDRPYIRVKAGKVQAGLLAKAILAVLGYSFCLSFVKPEVDIGEIIRYSQSI